MDVAREKRVLALLEEALGRASPERTAFLTDACGADTELLGRVERLLAVQAERGEIPVPELAIDWSALLASGAAGPFVGDRVGAYTIVRRLALGGMARVFEAEQDRPRRLVALKVVRPESGTPEALAAFEREAEVLGRLQHPSIASVFEAGTFDGPGGRQPFLAMELVAGQRLDVWAREERPDQRRKLRVFAQVCAAVEHAHARGVLHCDLKSANVMVAGRGAEERPVVLDFGVARALDRTTGVARDTALEAGTPATMSPEQAGGGVLDARSDVYALGAVLYELLSGRAPLDLAGLSLAEARGAIAVARPAALGTLRSELAGDLEAICAQALAKAPDERYATAAELGRDVERVLARRPVHARPATLGYRAKKLVERHPAPFAVGIVGLAVAGFLVNRAVRAGAGERRAADAVGGLVGDLVAASRPTDAGPGTTLADVLAAAERHAAEALAERPLELAALRMQLGRELFGLSLYADAEEAFRAAHGARERLLGEEHADTLEALAEIGATLRQRGELDAAEPILTAVEELGRRRFGEFDRRALRALGNLAQLRLDQGRIPEAADAAQRQLALLREHFGADDVDLVAALEVVAQCRFLLGDLRTAEELFREQLGLNLARGGPEHPGALLSRQNLMVTLVERGIEARLSGDEDAALALFGEAVREARGHLVVAARVFGSNHLEYLKSTGTLADVLDLAGQSEEALSVLRAALERGRFRVDTPAAPDATLLRGLEGAGLAREAAELRAAAARGAPIETDDLHPVAAVEWHRLAAILQNLDRDDEACDVLSAVLERQRAVLGADAPDALETERRLARARERAGGYSTGR